MQRAFRFCLVAVATAGLYGMSLAQAQAECTTVGAAGDGIGEDLAKFMAQAGLKNIIDAKGLKPQGAITFKCEPGAIVTECHAQQKACK